MHPTWRHPILTEQVKNLLHDPDIDDIELF